MCKSRYKAETQEHQARKDVQGTAIHTLYCAHL